MTAGKHVVTANKDLIALHGNELVALAKEYNCDLYYEASVAGGIPILRTIVDSLASDEIQKVFGIVNGTTNFILSQMTNEGKSYSEALKEAQELAVPSLAENGKKKLTVIVKNVGKSDLEITDLQVFNPALGVQLKKRVLKPGAQTKMKITAYGKYLKKVKGTPRVLMITNDPNCPKVIVKVNVTD